MRTSAFARKTALAPVSAVLPLLLAVPALGQACFTHPASLPEATVVCQESTANPCPVVLAEAGRGQLPNTTLARLTIQAPNGPTPIDVDLRISVPPGNVRGTVVASSGAGGNRFFEDTGAARPALPVLRALYDRQYAIVQRAWGPRFGFGTRQGWFEDNIGSRQQSARYAILLRWIFDNVHQGGPLCAIGISAGCDEIGYALTTWGFGDADAKYRIDVAVLAGGPAMSRKDLICCAAMCTQALDTCPGNPSLAIPPPITAGNRWTGTPPPLGVWPNPVQCCYTSSLAWALCNKSRCSGAQRREDSCLWDGAPVRYPSTRVHVLLGERDVTSAVPQALLFHNAIISQKVIEFVPLTHHGVHCSAQGQDALVRAALSGMHAAPTRATLSMRDWGGVGDRITFDLDGPTGCGPNRHTWAIHASPFATTPVLPGPFGWNFLVSPLFVTAGAFDCDGDASFSFQIGTGTPADSELFFQAYVADHASPHHRHQRRHTAHALARHVPRAPVTIARPCTRRFARSWPPWR